MAVSIPKKRKQVRTMRGVDEKYTGPEPDWDGCENWTVEQFMKEERRASFYYNYFFTGKDLKEELYTWMKDNKYSTQDISKIKKVPDSYLQITVTALARNLNNGMTTLHKDEQRYLDKMKGRSGLARDRADFLHSQINYLLELANRYIDDAPKEKTVNKPNIQERIAEKAASQSEFIDEAIDAFIVNPKSTLIDNVYAELKKQEANSATGRMIKQSYEKMIEELQQVDNDDDLKEAYSYLTKPNRTKFIKFLQSVCGACDMIITETLSNKPKTVRKKKAKPASELVKSLKYMKVHEPLKLASKSPTELIGATAALVFNTRTRKIGLYIANDASGFGVKGTTLLNVNEETSLQKTLRTPDTQLPKFTKTTKTKALKTLQGIRSLAIKLKPRTNEHMIIMQVFK